MTHIILSPSVQILIRPDSAIQFGVDATRAGVLDMDSHEIAAGIVPVLVGLKGANRVGAVVDKLISAGLGHAAAASLIEDLLAYGILREATPHNVLMFGRGTLLDATAALIESAGFQPRIALRHETPAEFLTRPAAHVIILNRLAHTQHLAPLLAHRVPTYLTAALIDRRGLIGPGRRNHHGACLMCVDLHRTDIDPHWHSLVTQQPNGPTNPDPITEAATAARIAAIVQSGKWEVGQVEEIDPHAGTTTRTLVQTHPRCPVCWT